MAPTRDEPTQRWEMTEKAPRKHCVGCPLEHSCANQVTTEYRNRKNVKLFFVGEAPGKTEFSEQRPVVGPTGRILRRAIKYLTEDWAETSLAYGNVVRCVPRSSIKEEPRTPTFHEIEHCRRLVLQDIEWLDPEYVVLCGKPAIIGLAHDSQTGNRVNPDLRVSQLRGRDYIVKTPNGSIYPAVASAHFAYVSRQPKSAGVFLEDIDKALVRMDPTFPDYTERGRTVILDTVRKVEKVLNRMQHELTEDDIVAMDYETVDLSRMNPKILTVGFSYHPDKAYVIPFEHKETPFTGQEIRQIKELLYDFFAGPVSFGALVAHNLKFEAAVTVPAFGVGLHDIPVECSMLRAVALNENRKEVKGAFGLKPLVVEWLDFHHYEDDDIAPIVELRNRGRLADAPLRSLCEYNGMDCYVEWRLYDYEDRLAMRNGYDETLRHLSRTLLGPASVFATDLERAGIRVNKEHIRFLQSDESPLITRMAEIEEELYSLSTVKEANQKLLGKHKKVRGMQALPWNEEGASQSDVGIPWVFDVSAATSKAALVFGVLELDPIKHTATGKPKIDKELYEKYRKEYKEIELMAQWADLAKIKSTYVEGLYRILQSDPDMRDGRVRGRLKLHDTTTGRTAFERPNMQNIPRGKTEAAKDVKRLYMAEGGNVIVCLDYSQAEVRWMAEIARDRQLVREFKQALQVVREFEQNPTKRNARRVNVEGDFHTRTASQVFKVPPHMVEPEQRTKSKNVVFGNIYGMGPHLLSRQIKCTLEEAEEFQRMFFAQFPESSEWLERIEREGLNNGYVESPLGRRRHLNSFFLLGKTAVHELEMRAERDWSKISLANRGLLKHKSYEDRISRNSPIQGVASDTNLLACIRINKHIIDHDKPWAIINVVHDSIMAEIPYEDVEEYVEIATEIAESRELFSDFGFRPRVPFVVDVSVGVTWGDQYDVSPAMIWKLKCASCGKSSKIYVERTRKCPECKVTSNKNKLSFEAGPLPKVLKFLKWKYDFEETEV